MEILIWTCIIFLARVVDVGLGTVRVQLIVRRNKALASLTGFAVKEISSSNDFRMQVSEESSSSTASTYTYTDLVVWGLTTAAEPEVCSGTPNYEWKNDSWTAMSGTDDWSNVTKYVNETLGATIRWKVYANDSADNWNVSDIFTYTTTLPTLDGIVLNAPASDGGLDITNPLI